MTVSDTELQLAQLALARGLVDLASLLGSVTWAVTTRRDFSSALVERGLIEEATLTELRCDLAAMDAGEIQRVFDEGETIVIRSLNERACHESATLFEGLFGPLDTTATLDMPPEASLTPSPGLVGSGAEERYQFLDELGRGGMGQVLRAHDRVLDREIALKTLLPEAGQGESRDRLVAEACLTGRLEHPSIVPVYDVGHLSNGEPFYTMRVVTERSLEMVLQQVRDDDPEAPSLLQLIQILRQACLAIQFAHDHGVIHRDLKPENILIGDYGEVFVIDWGIAKLLSTSPDQENHLDIENQAGALIGTPRYMSPEQAHGHNNAVDERTDVYGLGAILYEMLTLTPVFSSPSVLALLMTIIQEEPEPPSQRSPDRKVPRALEEICLQAIAKDPADRYSDANALADELELFLEGVKERDRKEATARQLIDEAEKVLTSYREVRLRLAQSIKQRDALQQSTPAWADEATRAHLWDREQQVDDLTVASERHFGEATRLLSQSLGHSSLTEAHDALAQLYWERFIDAEHRDDRARAAYFETLVRQHDRGAFTERLRGLASLKVSCLTPDVTLTLAQVNERQRRLVADQVISVSETPLCVDRIPHGRYEIRASAPGFCSVQVPVLLERQDSQVVEISLYRQEKIPADFVVILGGAFQSERNHHLDPGAGNLELPTFAIQRTPVTCGQYAEFLTDIARHDLEKAMAHAPRSQADSPSYFPFVDGRFIVPEEDSDGDAWDPEWPICIVNYHDASAYARWRSARDGRSYRLASTLEWEKAARGVDGRLYPWGNHFDPSFCKMRDSAPGKAMPAPVASFPVDRSPYGVMDMAGGICEWTSTPYKDEADTYLIRGSSYNSIALMCRLDWSLHSAASYRSPHYGFRLVLELSEPDI